MNEYTNLVDTPEARRLLGTEWNTLPEPDMLPLFPVHLLPSPGREMVEAVSESLQVDVGMAACFLLGVVSTCLLGRVCVKVKKDYTEPIQLMIIVAANPSERKTSVMTEMSRPLLSFIRVENDKRKPEIDRQHARMAMLQKQREQAERKGYEGDLMGIVEKIAVAENNAVKYLQEPLTDQTPEALCAFMARNDGCASILSDEGGFFNILTGAYSNNVNLDIVLKGYSGGDVAVERVGRQPVRIKSASLAITLALQPFLLTQFLSDDTMIGRGLCARFLYAVPPSRVGERNVRAEPVQEIVRIGYQSRMMDLAKLQLEIGTRELYLSSEAQEAYFIWAQEVENYCAPGRKLDGLAGGWGGKLVGNTVRIAGIVKMMNDPDTRKPITVEQFSNAVEIAKYFMAHTLAASGRDRKISNEASEVLDAIRYLGQPSFKPSEMRQKMKKRKRFEAFGAVDNAMLELENAGYIRHGARPPWNGVGREPELLYDVHPDLLHKIVEEIVI